MVGLRVELDVSQCKLEMWQANVQMSHSTCKHRWMSHATRSVAAKLALSHPGHGYSPGQRHCVAAPNAN